jgi:hypothetical protein
VRGTPPSSGSKRGRAAAIVAPYLSFLALSCSHAATGPARPGVVHEPEPSVGVKPPEGGECREACERRSQVEDCADEEGNMMACPCHCP